MAALKSAFCHQHAEDAYKEAREVFKEALVDRKVTTSRIFD